MCGVGEFRAYPVDAGSASSTGIAAPVDVAARTRGVALCNARSRPRVTGGGQPGARAPPGGHGAPGGAAAGDRRKRSAGGGALSAPRDAGIRSAESSAADIAAGPPGVHPHGRLRGLGGSRTARRATKVRAHVPHSLSDSDRKT
ncbi:hypothetical protein GCM10023205_39570 [Yinghuangia aomiensis]|uniref:Uncharacterized protein n=1 Tax=Yinghuangia aomiensis TaxID=676205 RepID=A0ABP9HG21_9ACTN